jgi:hypothetical protein
MSLAAAAEPLLVLAIVVSAYTAIMVALLIASQVAGVSRTIPWPRWFWLSAALWIAWVIVR